MVMLKILNVYRASYGYCKKYGEDKDYNYPKSIEQELELYVVDGYLKTDIESLTNVAKILPNEMVVVNDDGTISFFDGNY